MLKYAVVYIWGAQMRIWMQRKMTGSTRLSLRRPLRRLPKHLVQPLHRAVRCLLLTLGRGPSLARVVRRDGDVRPHLVQNPSTGSSPKDGEVSTEEAQRRLGGVHVTSGRFQPPQLRDSAIFSSAWMVRLFVGSAPPKDMCRGRTTLPPPAILQPPES